MPYAPDKESVLSDRSACLRILWALKAGIAPREGIRFLSVGLDRTVQRLQRTFEQVRRGVPEILWLIGDYGEGKSHLLRLAAALAEEQGFAWAYVVHDKDQNIGLHKPARLFWQILWALQWEYPDMYLQWFNSVMTSPPYYDRRWRYIFPQKLKVLSILLLKQKWRGLVICIDELENCCQLQRNQHVPACETLLQLSQHLEGPMLLCLALTNSGLESLIGLWRYYGLKEAEELLWRADNSRITMPAWSEEFSLPLTERIHHLHSVAFNWQPKVSPEDVAEKASERARTVSSGRWRVFVQTAVQLLEIEHQRTVVYQSYQPPAVQPPKPPTPVVPIPPLPKQPLLAQIQEGDRVEIVKTRLRGLRGVVERVKGDEAEVVLDGRVSMRIRLPLDALKKLR